MYGTGSGAFGRITKQPDFFLCKASHNKKNWLFVCSERAGKRAAVIQTLFGTAKLNGINPEIWLKDVQEKLPTWPNSRIDELLPLAPEVIAELISDKI